jgi:hypothetical protein
MLLLSAFQANAEEQNQKCARPYPEWVLREEFEEKFKKAFFHEMYGLKPHQQMKWLTVEYQIATNGKPTQLQFLDIANQCNQKCLDLAEKIIMDNALSAPQRIDPKTFQRTDLNNAAPSDRCYRMEFTYTEPPSLREAAKGIVELFKSK